MLCQGYDTDLDILRADVDLPPPPVRAGVDRHPGLLPLQLVAQADGDNLHIIK